MPEKERHLTEALAHLHEELQAADEVDGSTREALTSIRDEIDAVLATPRAERDETSQPLVDALRAAVDEFEESHPTLMRVLGNLADTLTGMGI